MAFTLDLRARGFRSPPVPARPDERLEAARQDVVDAVADVGRAAARQLQLKARLCRSIPELWELRPGVFELVAQCHTETEAWRRLARLNRHFPTRSPRSGFGALDPIVPMHREER